jgi:hypothetical protein
MAVKGGQESLESPNTIMGDDTIPETHINVQCLSRCLFVFLLDRFQRRAGEGIKLSGIHPHD